MRTSGSRAQSTYLSLLIESKPAITKTTLSLSLLVAMFTMESIAQKNAEAVDLFFRGDNRQATTILVGALRDLHALLRDAAQSEEDETTLPSTPTAALVSTVPTETGAQDSPSPDMAASSSTIGSLDCGAATLTSQEVEYEETSDLPGYYPRPFEIVVGPTTAINPIGTLAEASSVLLFNLALVSHRQGLTLGNSTLLLSALRIYKQAMQQLQVATLTLTASSNLTDRLVLMSAMSYNQVLLYMTMCDFAAAQFEIGMLVELVGHLELAYLSFEIPQQLERSIGDINDAETTIFPVTRDLRFFRLSVAFLGMYDFRFAPAA